MLHQLWLEVTGFVFLALAFIGAVALFREFARYQAGQTTTGSRDRNCFHTDLCLVRSEIVLASVEERLSSQSSVFGRGQVVKHA